MAKTPIILFDSVTVSNIPKDALAVAGYVNGLWKTYPELEKAFPHAHKLSIAVTAQANAQTLDVERGDATVREVPAWIRRQFKRGVKKPAIYTSVSNAQNVVNELSRSGIKRKQVRIWTAHWTGHPHLCTRNCDRNFKSRADATQYESTKTVDKTYLSKKFFAAPKPPLKKRVVKAIKAIRWLRFGRI